MSNNIVLLIIPSKYNRWENIPKQNRDHTLYYYEQLFDIGYYRDNAFNKRPDYMLVAWDRLKNGSLDSSEFGKFDHEDLMYRSPIYDSIKRMVYEMNLNINSFYLGRSEEDMLINIVGNDHFESGNSKQLILEEIFK